MNNCNGANVKSLFEEHKLKGLSVKNRVVMPPFCRPAWATQDGYITEKHIRHYEKICEGGPGIIITESAAIRQEGRNFDSQVGIWSDQHIDGYSKIVDACNKHSAVPLLQIFYVNIGALTRRLTIPIDKIKKLQDDFILAAIRAKKAGYKGVELHGAHGFLLNQFTAGLSKMKSKEYSGDISQRVKFPIEIIEGIKSECGSDFIIGYRLGANSPVLEDSIEIAKYLEKAGVDLLHVSYGGGHQIPGVPYDFDYDWVVYSGTVIKKHVNIPVIAVSHIRTPESAAYLVENNLADYVAVGRGMMADPLWVKKAQNNEKVNLCLDCLPMCKCYIDADICPVNQK